MTEFYFRGTIDVSVRAKTEREALDKLVEQLPSAQRPDIILRLRGGLVELREAKD